MSKQTYSHQSITEYLLGSLPEAEAERFDELSFTDDEFAEALRVAEKDLVDAYVRGELTGTTQRQFQSHYLASPLRREQTRFAEALRLFADREEEARVKAGRAGTIDKANDGKSSGAWFPALSGYVSRPLWRWGAAFAALVLLVAGVWLARENTRLRGRMAEAEAQRETLDRRERELRAELESRRSAGTQTEQELARVREERARLDAELAEARERERANVARRAVDAGARSSPVGEVAVASFVLTPQMRAAGQPLTISLPRAAQYAAMRLELEPNDYSLYRVMLLDASGNRTLWRSGTLKAHAAGMSDSLNLILRAGLLQSRAYTLRVTGVAASGASEVVGDYPFRVARK